MITAIAVDDEPAALDIIRIHAEKVAFIELKETFYSAKQALDFIKQHPVELLFLDINMPGMTGIELAELMGDQQQVIFMTAYPEYAIKGYDLGVTDYLLKPVNFDRFLKACNLANKRLAGLSPVPETLFVKDGLTWVSIPIDQLRYIKAEDNYVSLVQDKKTTLTRMTLQEMLEKLPADKFVRVHRSFIVNLSAIKKIEADQIHIDEQIIPLSRSYKEQLMRQLI